MNWSDWSSSSLLSITKNLGTPIWKQIFPKLLYFPDHRLPILVLILLFTSDLGLTKAVISFAPVFLNHKVNLRFKWRYSEKNCTMFKNQKMKGRQRQGLSFMNTRTHNNLVQSLTVQHTLIVCRLWKTWYLALCKRKMNEAWSLFLRITVTL